MTTPRRASPAQRGTRPEAAPPAATVATRVALEQGRTWTFACAVDWPGWCRRAKSEALALEALLDYAGRYAPVAGPGMGARVPPRTPWQEQRARLTEALAASRSGGAWTPRYAIRRCAWHVLDHAWEIEDKRA